MRRLMLIALAIVVAGCAAKTATPPPQGTVRLAVPAAAIPTAREARGQRDA